MVVWDPTDPHRRRTWVRSRPPYFLIAANAGDCEDVRAEHLWHDQDGKSSGCYHCSETQEPAATPERQPFRWGRVLALAAAFSTLMCLRHWIGIREPGFLPVPIGEAFEDWPLRFGLTFLAVGVYEQFLGRTKREE